MKLNFILFYQMGDKAAKSASKPRSKIIVSGIPPETTEELFLESVLKEWSECVNYVDFYQGKKTQVIDLGS